MSQDNSIPPQEPAFAPPAPRSAYDGPSTPTPPPPPQAAPAPDAAPAPSPAAVPESAPATGGAVAQPATGTPPFPSRSTLRGFTPAAASQPEPTQPAASAQPETVAPHAAPGEVAPVEAAPAEVAPAEVAPARGVPSEPTHYVATSQADQPTIAMPLRSSGVFATAPVPTDLPADVPAGLPASEDVPQTGDHPADLQVTEHNPATLDGSPEAAGFAPPASQVPYQPHAEADHDDLGVEGASTAALASHHESAPLYQAPDPEIIFAQPAPAPESRGGKKGLSCMTIIVSVLVTLALVAAGLWALWTYGRHLLITEPHAPQSGQTYTPDPPPLTDVDPQAAPHWESVSAAVSPSVVTISVSDGSRGGGVGSGVIYSNDGLIITNHHVIADAQGEGGKIAVTLPDQRIYTAQIVGTDPTSDLGVIRLDNPPSDLTVASFGTSSNLVVGQPVMAIGAPLGLSNTVTTGIVSALDRPVEVSATHNVDPEDPFGQLDPESAGDTIVTNAIQVDASINPGNSGGPLFNQQGQVIGINSSIASIAEPGSDRAGSIGLGFAIPVDLVRSVADQLINNGKVAHALLGVSITSVAGELDGARHLGALIEKVVPGGAADLAGLRENDLITHVNGKRVPSAKALQGVIRQYTAGTEVTVTVIREGQSVEVHAALQALDKE